MSSRYTMICPSPIRSFRMWFVNAWKVVSELVRLKNITVGSYRPLLVLKAAFHLSPSVMWMLLYPHHMSILEK